MYLRQVLTNYLPFWRIMWLGELLSGQVLVYKVWESIYQFGGSCTWLRYWAGQVPHSTCRGQWSRPCTWTDRDRTVGGTWPACRRSSRRTTGRWEPRPRRWRCRRTWRWGRKWPGSRWARRSTRRWTGRPTWPQWDRRRDRDAGDASDEWCRPTRHC